ncbi:RTA1 like protein-domain-containing protein [Biscogniauxia sp. FL1348]|nr:RTA1 like protein-domain-containing protein [Biscogniauxia sp. FL1348]
MSSSHIAFKDCTAELCPYSRSFYQYRIWLAPNVAFAAIFLASLLGYAGVYMATRRRAVGFTLAMSAGLACEVGGYLGRVQSWRNQWSSGGFILQTTSLTFAPAFVSAAIYLCLRKVVRAYGPQHSRVPPEWYAYIFIPCDVVCLIAQAGGGTLSALAARDHRDTDTGDSVIMVGLSLQVATLLVFVGLVVDFGVRAWRRGGGALDQDAAAMVAVRRSAAFRGFVAALALSTACVLARCVYRILEMSGGYEGPLMARQDLFVAFEGGMISVAVLALNFFHPSLCFDRLVPDEKCLGPTAAAAKSCDDLKRSISVNSFNRDFVGSSLGPGGYDTSSKVSTSSSFDVIPEDAYERPVNSLGRDLTSRFSKGV